MQNNLSQLSQQARIAVQRRDWATVATVARKIQKQYKKDPEGYFLSGLAEKATRHFKAATSAFVKALKLDQKRYDAAIELANLYLLLLRHAEAYELLCRYQSLLDNSPLYLDMAATTFTRLGLHAKALPLYKKATQLQPDLDLFRANLAACSVLLGKADEAQKIYLQLLEKYPNHQKNHYELSRLKKAKDSAHIEQMENVLKLTRLPADKNIFLYYALGKELEDLKRWQESFHYYKLAGDAVSSVSNYNVADDIALIDKMINVCDKDWLQSTIDKPLNTSTKTPIFIVGLPRTGTTLMERIVSSHSQVESADETFFMQLAIRHASGEGGAGEISEAIIESAAKKDIRRIEQKYMSSVSYRLSDRAYFIDKYPYNFLYLGFIAKAFPTAKIIYLRRNPMDACFAMYKQSFFKFAYSLENLGRYYVAQDRLRRHWQAVLKGRLLEVDYETLVTDQEGQTRAVLEGLGLEFEEACMNFEQNPTSSASASTLQVREKVHTQSVHKWKHFSDELEPLKNYLEQSSICIKEN